MGWKASCIFVSEQGPGFFAKERANDPAKCRELADALGFEKYRFEAESTLMDGIHPDNNIIPRRLVIGAYEGGCFVGHNSLWMATSKNNTSAGPLLDQVIERFPNATVLVIGLHSVVDFWMFALYEKGRLIRQSGGTGDDGVIVDNGESLPIESKGYEGEDLVFHVTALMTGYPLDRDGPHLTLPTSAFLKPTWFQSLFGGR